MPDALPSGDELFATFFAPWYPEGSQYWEGHPQTRPDIMGSEVFLGKSGDEISSLDAEGKATVQELLQQMLAAAESDLLADLGLSLPVTLESVHAADHHFDPPFIAEIIAQSDPQSFDNAYVVYCCEFGMLLAAALRNECPELEWMYAWPYWESALFHPPTGKFVFVFHWAIKKLSESGVADGYAEKIVACRQILRGEVAG